MKIEIKRLEMAVAMSHRKAGSFAKRAKTVRPTSRDLQADGEEICPDCNDSGCEAPESGLCQLDTCFCGESVENCDHTDEEREKVA